MKIELEGVIYICPKTKKKVIMEFSTVSDWYLHTEDGCPSCRHGEKADLEINIDCPECGQQHTIELRN